MPLSALAWSRRWWSGTRTFQRSTVCAQKLNVPEALRRRSMNTIPRQTPTLLELQRWMAAQIVNRDRLDAFTHEEGHCSELIAVPQRGTVAERLRVYAGGY